MKASSQRGWMMVEVILCLALFAVVLHFAQQQSQLQWQTVQNAEEQYKQESNQQKQRAMTQLVGEQAWLEESSAEWDRQYPDCEQCKGSQFQAWFHASQYILLDDE